MARTVKGKAYNMRSFPGRARGGTRQRAKLQRSCRQRLNREALSDEPQLIQAKKLDNFWWSYW